VAIGEVVGEVGVGNGWKLVFDEPMLVDAVEGFDELNFSNADLFVLPNVVPVEPDITDEWLRDWHHQASATAVEKGAATQDLGRIDGDGWSGSMSYGTLDDGAEHILVGYLAGSQAILHLTVRFRDPPLIGTARRLIGAVRHDAAGAADMDRALAVAETVYRLREE